MTPTPDQARAALTEAYSLRDDEAMHRIAFDYIAASEKEIAEWKDRYDLIADDFEARGKIIDAQAELLNRVREVLSPFADAKYMLKNSDDDDAIIAPNFMPNIDFVICCVSDIRKAAHLVKEIKDQTND